MICIKSGINSYIPKTNSNPWSDFYLFKGKTEQYIFLHYCLQVYLIYLEVIY